MVKKNLFRNGIVILGAMLALASCSSENNSSNAKKQKTVSGFDFVVIEDVPGVSPQLDEFAFFDLTVTSADSLIQSSHQQKEPFMVKVSDDRKMYGAFAPVIDMMRTMSVGDSSVLYFPRDSFANGGVGMEQFADMIQYELALKEIMNPEQFKVYQDSIGAIQAEKGQILKAREPEVAQLMNDNYKTYKSGGFKNDLVETETGLRYIIHDAGDVSNPIDAGSFVNVLYYGTLEKDNSMFDNAFRAGRAFGLTVGMREVIGGWDEGLALLNYGAKATFYIPSALGYGERGSPPNIGPGDDLIFYVEILND